MQYDKKETNYPLLLVLPLNVISKYAIDEMILFWHTSAATNYLLFLDVTVFIVNFRNITQKFMVKINGNRIPDQLFITVNHFHMFKSTK